VAACASSTVTAVRPQRAPRPDAALAAAFAPGGTLLAVARSTGIELVDMLSGENVATLPQSTGQWSRLAWTTNGILAAAGRTGVKAWNTAPAALCFDVSAQTPGTVGLTVTPDGRRMLTGDAQALRVWDLTGGRELLAIPAHDGWVTAVALAPDGLDAFSPARTAASRCGPRPQPRSTTRSWRECGLRCTGAGSPRKGCNKNHETIFLCPFC